MGDWAFWSDLARTFLTPLIAVGVAIIAYRQWKTANDKLVLDLFEMRLAVYSKVRKAVSTVNTHGRTDSDAERELLEAIDMSQFLFGADVRSYLDEMWRDFSGLNVANAQAESEYSETRKKAIEAHGKIFIKITAFYNEGAFRFSPYMSMHHKLSSPDQTLRKGKTS